MPRFVLGGPQLCKICFCAHTLCMNYVTKMFLLGSYSVSSTQQLCFVHGQDQKREQKHTTKNFVEFHNNPLLLTMPRLRLLELTRQTLRCKSSSLSCSTFKGCSIHKSVHRPLRSSISIPHVQVWTSTRAHIISLLHFQTFGLEAKKI